MKRSFLAFLLSVLVLIVTSCASNETREVTADGTENPDRVVNKGSWDIRK